MAAYARIYGFQVVDGKHIEGREEEFTCLGAAGAVEAAICWLYLASGDVKGAAMSNSFAFGGSNASVVLATEDGR